jgi:hypothetical protein
MLLIDRHRLANDLDWLPIHGNLLMGNQGLKSLHRSIIRVSRSHAVAGERTGYRTDCGRKGSLVADADLISQQVAHEAADNCSAITHPGGLHLNLLIQAFLPRMFDRTISVAPATSGEARTPIAAMSRISVVIPVDINY